MAIGATIKAASVRMLKAPVNLQKEVFRECLSAEKRNQSKAETTYKIDTLSLRAIPCSGERALKAQCKYRCDHPEPKDRTERVGDDLCGSLHKKLPQEKHDGYFCETETRYSQDLRRV